MILYQIEDHNLSPNFLKSLFETLKVDTKLSSAFHPQMDGQMERVNQVLEQYLCCTINYQQDDWTSHLTLAEFVYNNTIHTSTCQTPFYANYRYHFKFDLLNIFQMDNSIAKDLTSRLLEL